MELALGCFPYGKWATIFEQLNAVVNGPPPKLPEDGRFSKMMQEFANAWYVEVICHDRHDYCIVTYPPPT